MDDSNTAVTKADLAAGLAALETRLNERHEILRSELHHTQDALIERIVDSETKLLQAFYSLAESNQHRLALVESNANAVSVRLATLETRMLEVEKRLNMPPAA